MNFEGAWCPVCDGTYTSGHRLMCPKLIYEQRGGSMGSQSRSSALELQVGGDHYKSMKIQPVEFSIANNLSFIQGNIIKYICRYKNKNGRKDLEKIKHYVDLLIELEYGQEVSST
jgi:hypothetical protein